MKIYYFLFSFCLLIVSNVVFSQVNIVYRNEKINSYDKNGKRTGKWITFINEDTARSITSIGNYSKGIRIGEWRYYKYTDVVTTKVIDFKGNGSFVMDFGRERIVVNRDSTIIKWVDLRSRRWDKVYIICKKRNSFYYYKRFDLRGPLLLSDTFNNFYDAFDAVTHAH